MNNGQAVRKSERAGQGESNMTEFKRIDGYRYNDDSIRHIEHNEEGKIRDLLLGRRIEKADDEHLLLDNGIVIKVIGNEGCGGCTAGDYYVDGLNGCDNIVTRVELVETEDEDSDKWETDRTYRIFVVAEDKRVEVVTVTGNDGNGYYGTGYSLLVREGAT